VEEAEMTEELRCDLLTLCWLNGCGQLQKNDARNSRRKYDLRKADRNQRDRGRPDSRIGDFPMRSQTLISEVVSVCAKII
jgi:hypothetical protein